MEFLELILIFINDQNEKANKEIKIWKHLEVNMKVKIKYICRSWFKNLEKDGDSLINNFAEYKISDQTKVARDIGGIKGGILLGIWYNKATSFRSYNIPC